MTYRNAYSTICSFFSRPNLAQNTAFLNRLGAYWRLLHLRYFVIPLLIWWPIVQTSDVWFSTDIALSFFALCLLGNAVSIIRSVYFADDVQASQAVKTNQYEFRFSETSVLNIVKSHLLIVLLISIFCFPVLIFFAFLYLLNQAFYAQFPNEYWCRLLLLCADIGLAIMVGNLLIV